MSQNLGTKPTRQRHFLREWRNFRDRNQADVADALEVDQSTISKVERGLLPYNQDLLERLAIIYGCEPVDLIEVNPLAPRDRVRLVYSSLKKAPQAVQDRAAAIIEALLKAG